jgi:hypothetical protein
VSEDGLTYEFVLRKDAIFHNGSRHIGSYPERDALFLKQAAELYHKRRERSSVGCSRSFTNRRSTADLAVGLHQRRPRACGRVGFWTNPGVSLHGAL